MTTWNQKINHNEDWGGNEAIVPHVHISLRWMDACAWYQLATLLSISYCMAYSHVLRTKHVKVDEMYCT